MTVLPTGVGHVGILQLADCVTLGGGGVTDVPASDFVVDAAPLVEPVLPPLPDDAVDPPLLPLPPLEGVDAPLAAFEPPAADDEPLPAEPLLDDCPLGGGPWPWL